MVPHSINVRNKCYLKIVQKKDVITNIFPGKLQFNPFLHEDECLRNSSRRSFENSVAKGEIAHDEQLRLWPQYFQLYLTIKLSFMEMFQVFVTILS